MKYKLRLSLSKVKYKLRLSLSKMKYKLRSSLSKMKYKLRLSLSTMKYKLRLSLSKVKYKLRLSLSKIHMFTLWNPHIKIPIKIMFIRTTTYSYMSIKMSEFTVVLPFRQPVENQNPVLVII